MTISKIGKRLPLQTWWKESRWERWVPVHIWSGCRVPRGSGFWRPQRIQTRCQELVFREMGLFLGLHFPFKWVHYIWGMNAGPGSVSIIIWYWANTLSSLCHTLLIFKGKRLKAISQTPLVLSLWNNNSKTEHNYWVGLHYWSLVTHTEPIN